MDNCIYLSWVAGFIDGEGCFYVRRIPKKGKDFWITISQNYPRGEKILNEIKTTLNIGNVYNKGNKTVRGRGWYFLLTQKAQLLEFLPLLIPYLKIKKEEAIRFYLDLKRWQLYKI